jgi:NADH-ubiquinone oxidoreductase chain 1
MTEHAAVIFVFFFLAEYASIVLICTLTSILFLGGYLLNLMPILYTIEYIDTILFFDYEYLQFTGYYSSEDFLLNPLIEGLLCSVILGIKSCIMIFIFI